MYISGKSGEDAGVKRKLPKSRGFGSLLSQMEWFSKTAEP
jgi:hypothetical protein